MVWTCEKERSRVCREKDTGDGGAGKEKGKGRGRGGWMWCGEDMESVGVVEEDVVNRGV